MKTSLFKFSLVFLMTGLAPLPACAQNQHEMNAEARASFEKADAELNKVYKKLLATLDAESQAKLKIAQRAWVALRNAEADFRADREARGGSMAPMIYSGVAAELTQARVKALQKLLEPVN